MKIRYACDFEECSNENATKRCSVCKVARYCSEPCQKKHWKVHKKICDSSLSTFNPRVVITKIFATYKHDILNVFIEKSPRKGGVFTVALSDNVHEMIWWDFHLMEERQFASPEKIQEMREAFESGLSVYGIAQDNKLLDAIYFRKEKN